MRAKVLAPILLLASLAACGTDSEPAPASGLQEESIDASVPATPCREVKSVLFDLGETLVAADEQGGFVERAAVEPLLEQLRARGMQLGVITTVPDDWNLDDLRAALPRPGLLDAFDVVLLSSQSVAPPKPAPAAYREAVSLLPVPHAMEQSVYVTESLEEIADREVDPSSGARATGMLGLHISSAAPSPLADYTVDPTQLGAIATIAETEWAPCSSP